MQIFELHFNPKAKKDYSFDTFIYRPEKASEKRMGGLYALGEVKSSLPQDLRLLNDLAENIKKNFYSSLVGKPETSLTNSLRSANSFLSEEVQRNNVHWLGNLGFAVLSIKGLELSFTKTGNIKILLARAGNIIDIGGGLEKQEIDPYPLKVFFNVISGKIEQSDLMMMMTEKVYDFLSKKGLLSRLADKGGEIEEKEIKEILPSSLFKKEDGAETAGALMILAFKKELKKESPTTMLFQNQKSFSWKGVFDPVLAPIRRLKRKTFKKSPKKRTKKRISVPFRLSKKVILILLLLAILLLGFLIFRQSQENKKAEAEKKISQVEKKIAEAENYSLFDQKEEANDLLKQAWKEISLLPSTPRVEDLKETTEQKLFRLNNLEEIENPVIVSEIDSQGPNAVSILAAGDSVYLQSQGGVYQIYPKEQFVPSNQPISLAANYQNKAIFYSPPKNIISLDEQGWISKSIEPWKEEFVDAVSYWSSIYFLTRDCQIVKYPSVAKLQWGVPRNWLEDDFSCSKPKSLAIDGSVWILGEENKIWEFYQGVLKKEVKLDIFPFIEKIERITTNAALPYLYLLEPSQKRIIIVDKEKAQVVKQIRSNKFTDLRDLAISETGETAWILNGNKVYQIGI
jgi:cell division protein FtsL